MTCRVWSETKINAASISILTSCQQLHDHTFLSIGPKVPYFFSRDKFVGHSFFFSRFFSVKIDISFINSIFSGEIKNNPPKKQFFHLLKYIPKKCVKTKLFWKLKKYGNFDRTEKNIEKNIIDQSHVHKNLATPLSFGPLNCCSVKWEVNTRGPPSL